MKAFFVVLSPMLRDVEILAISRIVRRDISLWFVFTKEAVWAEFVHYSIGHNIPVQTNYVFYTHPRI